MDRDDLSSRIVGDVMERWPQTVPIFNRHRMACPGCAMAPFMTVAEAAVAHRVKVRDLARDLATVIGPAGGGSDDDA